MCALPSQLLRLTSRVAERDARFVGEMRDPCIESVCARCLRSHQAGCDTRVVGVLILFPPSLRVPVTNKNHGGARNLSSSSVFDFKPRRPVRQWRIARQVWAKPSILGVLWLVGSSSMTSRDCARRRPGGRNSSPEHEARGR